MTFEEVYQRFRRPIWSLARRLTRNDEEALDASQEIFIRIWRGLDGFRGEAKMSTWVYRIAWNYLQSHRRRQGRQPVAMADAVGNRLLEVGALRDRAPDAERRVMAADEMAGKRGTCSQCKNKVTIPAPPSQSAAGQRADE